MKFLTIAVLFSLCTSVSAENPEMLAKAKEHSLANIDKRIGYLNELKSCISAAQTKEAMKTCRATHKAKKKALKESNQTWKANMKKEWKNKKK